MAFVIPTTQEQFETNLALLEGALGQQSPINDKAFLTVLAALTSGQFTSLYKWAVDAAKGNLAKTANRDQLILIGDNYGLPVKPATAASLTINLPAINGTTIPITRDFVGNANGIRYRILNPVVAAGGVAVINVTAKTEGLEGNLSIGDELSINTPVPGAQTVATVSAINALGANEEDTEDYRTRILDKIRATYGGGNAADYRKWAQEVAGVRRAFPFSGKPVDSGLASYPPDRTVYIETTTDIDPDGIPSPALIQTVRDAIITDPETGLARQPLGLTNDTLYVEPIIRTSLYATVYGLIINPDVEADAKAQFADAFDAYLRSCSPFVDGIDALDENLSIITDPAVSKIAQDVFSSYGGSLDGAGIGDVPLGSLSRYQLNANVTVKSGGVDYV